MHYRLIAAGLFSFFSLAVLADTVKPVLNQVLYQTSSEAWVTTQTAEITVSVNSTLDENQLAKARDDILNKLNNMAKSDWHITRFDRSPNESGLEQLHVLAQTRLPETALSDLRDRAKKASKPGETFKVENIAFEPTLAETEAVRKRLRNETYQKIQDELAVLNKTYPAQHYVVHKIDFTENILPQPMMKMGAANLSAAAAPITVTNKMTVNASVVLVSVNQ